MVSIIFSLSYSLVITFDQLQKFKDANELLETQLSLNQSITEAIKLNTNRITRLEARFVKLRRQVKAKKVIYAEVTAYNPIKSQTDNSPYTTAFLKRVHPSCVAVSRSIIHDLKWSPGDRIYIEGVGIRRIGDLMARRVKNYHIDLFMWRYRDAIRWGKRKCLVIYLGS